VGRSRPATKEEELQMKASPSTSEAPTSSTGTKTSMPNDVQAKMENSFGTSFGNVNIHQNDDSATQMGALAYTQGNNVHFAPGQYNPGTSKGQELLGHELTHVVQQRSGRVQPTKQGKGMPVNDSPALEHEADVMGKRAAEGKKNKSLENSNEIFGSYTKYIQKKEGDENSEDGAIVYKIKGGDTLSELAQKYDVSVESLAKWNNIKNVDKIYAGDEIYVSDPARNKARSNFESYPELKESTGWLLSKKGVQSMNVSSLFELGMASINNCEIANITGDLLGQVKQDPDMILKENILIEKIKADPRYGKEAFFMSGLLANENGKPGLELGGKRWSSSTENWSEIGSDNPILHKETWGVAANQLTWALRHCTVKYWAEVSQSGSIKIQYRLYDTLDLSGNSGRSDAYNNISNFLGFFYHTLANGNKNLQTRAQWETIR